IDFGIARNFQPGEKGTMIGTEGYSPPEQYRGEASPVGDLYALGATLHHLLTRRDPRAEPPFSFSERPIRDINTNVSPELEAVINGALAYDPKDRFPTSEAMKSALISAAKKTGLLTTRQVSTALRPQSEIESLWSFECEDEIRGTPLVNDSRVYVGCYDNNIYSLDSKTGNFAWKFATEGGIPGRPAFEMNQVIFGSEDHRLYAVSADNGELIWSYYA
ncbi:MAG: PQQ-binding-like beta-propeller repeat protein, partial [Armatimonadetes bacterium]|nr:PQQ-binding-like beta-propeller repeat protein [Armatimonadota bacterium]NIM67245.1 PQQ-binding-like beta-propeller repeat protein [Armatimonadota bacterium]NIN05432.1 PQQ-binding-like beta-propeller repeat protein [Armatimonadota bacterium]NIT32424.1 PQQ-binding-like beta-propeller repeat protein [Armatimonadota bacterium]